MKFTLTLCGLFALAEARAQLPTPPGSPPAVPMPSQQTPLPMTSPSASVIPIPIPPSQPIPIPSSGGGAPTQSGPPRPTVTGSPGQGPICECGYTYCASVLMAMRTPWSVQQLASAYCSTPNAVCSQGVPSTNVTSALYICLCGSVQQKLGNELELLCGCDTCLNIGPDYRGRCETPCSPGPCKA